MHILITRPSPDAESSAEKCMALGFTPLIAPLFTVEHLTEPKNRLQELMENTPPQAVLATSSNAVRALGKLSYNRQLFIVAVGEKTAQTAQQLGFRNVVITGGNALLLTEWVKHHCRPEKGALLYIRGEVIAVPVKALLESAGFQVEELVLYRTHPVSSLPDIIREILDKKTETMVPFYSRQAAMLFAQLLQQEHKAAEVTAMTACALSHLIAEPLVTFPWKALQVAAQPTETSLMEMIYNEFRRAF